MSQSSSSETVNWHKQMEYDLFIATSKIYERYVGILISKSPSFQNYLLLHEILNQKKFVVPAECFNYIATKSSSKNVLNLLLIKKIEFDKYVEKVVKVCAIENNQLLDLYELERVLEKHNLNINLYHKYYIYNLLANDGKICYHLPDLNKKFEIKNIGKNYVNIQACTDNTFCEAAYYANHNMLEKIIVQIEELHLPFKFQPGSNRRHARCMDWINKNIKIGEENPEALLGWTDGPCSMPWPSTNLLDYENTLSLLNSFMCNNL